VPARKISPSTEGEGRIMVRKLVLGLVTLLALAGAASACPYSASNTTDDSTSTSQLPTTTDTGTKTGG
jgi:hypothetical protein